MIITKEKFFENRGNIYTLYDSRDHKINFVQDKISKSYQGVIRGFHADNHTWKLISCLHGKIKLVTYDIDNDKKNDYILDGDDEYLKSVLIPPRTLNAHQCLSSNCIFHYKWSQYYTSPEDQWSVFFNDVDINPCWDTRFKSIISDRDSNAQSLKELKTNVL